MTAQCTMEHTNIVKRVLKASGIATDTVYRELVKMTNALVLIFGEADYTNFINYTNMKISLYKQELINERSASSKDEESDTA